MKENDKKDRKNGNQVKVEHRVKAQMKNGKNSQQKRLVEMQNRFGESHLWSVDNCGGKINMMDEQKIIRNGKEPEKPEI
jgi:hypothetical protein